MASFQPHHPPEDCINCEHRHLRMFCDLTPEALEDYDGIGIMMSHARGAKLFSEGDPARNVFVICFGQVKISSTSRDGKTMILKIAGPGDVMGLSAVLANVPHEVTAEAIEPCQVKTVRKQEFVDFLGRHGIASMHAAQSLSGELTSKLRTFDVVLNTEVIEHVYNPRGFLRTCNSLLKPVERWC